MLADGAVENFGLAFQGELEEESEIDVPDSAAIEDAPSTGLAPRKPCNKRPAGAVDETEPAAPATPQETPAQKKQRQKKEAEEVAKKASDSLLNFICHHQIYTSPVGGNARTWQ